MRYFIVVGEASGDLHASNLMRALRSCDADAEFLFVGGDLMAEASGQAPIVHYRDLAFMGFIPVLRNLGTIRRSARLVQQAMRSFAPDVVIPVDYAGFNMRYVLPFVAEHLACPLVYYIAPKLWAWKRWRIRPLARHTNLLLCILPFEQTFFAPYGVPSQYVGNPCVDATMPMRQRREQGLVEQKRQIAILAGSRQQELRANLPQMLATAAEFAEGYEIVVAGAPGLTAEAYAPYLSAYPKVALRFGDTYQIVAESEAALVTSGTATLEVALLGTPQVVCYRMGGHPWLRWMWDHLFSVPYISLVNLILERGAVPELIGSEVCPKRLVPALASVLEGGAERANQLRSVQELRQRLGDEPASLRAARAIMQHVPR